MKSSATSTRTLSYWIRIEMSTHISYKVANKLKEFLGESAPNPISNYWWTLKNGYRVALYKACAGYPAYQLHDLLSEPFCDAMLKEGIRTQHLSQSEYDEIKQDWPSTIAEIYFNGGLPDIEKALEQMMEAK